MATMNPMATDLLEEARKFLEDEGYENRDFNDNPNLLLIDVAGHMAAFAAERMAAENEACADLAERSVCMDCDCPHKYGIASGIRARRKEAHD